MLLVVHTLPFSVWRFSIGDVFDESANIWGSLRMDTLSGNNFIFHCCCLLFSVFPVPGQSTCSAPSTGGDWSPLEQVEPLSTYPECVHLLWLTDPIPSRRWVHYIVNSHFSELYSFSASTWVWKSTPGKAVRMLLLKLEATVVPWVMLGWEYAPCSAEFSLKAFCRQQNWLQASSLFSLTHFNDSLDTFIFQVSEFNVSDFNLL